MGAGQSSDRDGGIGSELEVKTSYYELLGVQRQATDDDIKKAYRRKALELHPDRNYGSEETATRTFAEVQAAYEVLSDPQERAWYDSHESAILRGDDGTTLNGAAPTAYQNVRLTTADDLARMVRKFNSNVDFSDSPSGFFGYLRETFEQLAKEEEAAASWENVDPPDYPSFGHKDDRYDDVVKRFYAVWSSFATIKNFAWKDKYKLSEAPDRWYRRRMEQENKGCRKEGIREFNEAVRSLVAFVRKRDPRYEPSTQSEAERQKVLRDAAASQAARARAANQAKLSEDAVPDWAKHREPEDLEESEEEEVEQEVLECVACSKVFKSERQWEAHEKSKKHQKAVAALQKKMRKDNAHLQLYESDPSTGIATPEVVDEDVEASGEVDDDDQISSVNGENAQVPDRTATHNGNTSGHMPESDSKEKENVDSYASGANEGSPIAQHLPNRSDPTPSETSSEDSNYTSLDTLQERLQSATLSDNTPPSIPSNTGATVPPTQTKVGKAKQKKAKKAAAAAHSAPDTADAYQCSTCNAAFPSKNRLFQHVKDFGHAALKSAPAAGGGGKGKKKR